MAGGVGEGPPKQRVAAWWHQPGHTGRGGCTVTCRCNGHSRPLLHAGLWDDTIKSPDPDTSQGHFPSSSICAPAQSNGDHHAFVCAGTHPKEAPAAAVLGPTQASCSLRAMWGLDAEAEGFGHRLRAGGGAGSCMRSVWGARGRALTAVTPLPRQFLPLMPVSSAHYRAISSRLTASETDDELPLISLKQSFVPRTAGDSKAPVEPIPLIARRAVTAAPAPSTTKGSPAPAPAY